MLAEEIDRGYERAVLLARLDDGTVPRLAGKARSGQAADQVPVRREAVIRAGREAEVVDARRRLVLRKLLLRARRLLGGDPEERLLVLAAAPAQAGAGEEAHAFVDAKARENVEPGEAALPLAAHVLVEDRPGQEVARVLDAVDAEVDRAVDVAEAGEALVDVFLAALARRDDRAESPARRAVEVDADAAEADEDTPVAGEDERRGTDAVLVAALEVRSRGEAETETDAPARLGLAEVAGAAAFISLGEAEEAALRRRGRARQQEDQRHENANAGHRQSLHKLESIREHACGTHADDAAVAAHQGGPPGHPGVLPDGRFLRAVL